MPEFLIRDIRTNRETWTAGPTLTMALVEHENARRRAAGEPLLSRTSRIGREDTGDSVISAWIGDSAICGRRENVEREG